MTIGAHQVSIPPSTPNADPAAPELLRTGATAATDAFSLGMVVREMGGLVASCAGPEADNLVARLCADGQGRLSNCCLPKCRCHQHPTNVTRMPNTPPTPTKTANPMRWLQMLKIIIKLHIPLPKRGPLLVPQQQKKQVSGNQRPNRAWRLQIEALTPLSHAI